MTAAPLTPEPSPFLTVTEAAREARMSVASIKRRCAENGLGFKPGGCGPWRIRRTQFERWLAGEMLK